MVIFYWSSMKQMIHDICINIDMGSLSLYINIYLFVFHSLSICSIFLIFACPVKILLSLPPPLLSLWGPHLDWKFGSLHKTQGCHNVLASEQVCPWYLGTSVKQKRLSSTLQESYTFSCVRWFAILILKLQKMNFACVYLCCLSSRVSTDWRPPWERPASYKFVL